MTTEDYNFWSLVFNFFTAVGTVGAVIVALFLARRHDEPKVCLFAGIRAFLDELQNTKEGVCITATNIGIREEGIQQWGYEIGVLRLIGISTPMTFCHITTKGESGIPGVKGFPGSIDPGKSVCHFLSYDDFDRLQLEFFSTYIETIKVPQIVKNNWLFLRLVLKTAVCWVGTSRNKIIKSRLEKKMQHYIVKAILQQREQEGDQTT